MRSSHDDAKIHPLQLKVAKPQPKVISNSVFSRQSILLTNGLANGPFVILSSLHLVRIFIGAADGAGGVGGVPPHLFPHQTPGMKPLEQGFIGEHHER